MNNFFLFFIFEDGSTVWAFWIGFFDESITDFACKHLFVVFLFLCTDGRHLAILHARENDFDGHVVAFESNLSLDRMLEGRGQILRSVEYTAIVDVGEINNQCTIYDLCFRRFNSDASLSCDTS
ncbi:MAG: hypothetical protein CL959_04950 [Euryarchaeota archaeon]|nr:hypothetical protein [Euryarchaeota archaeon]